jgi:hypothetical protein
MEKVLIKVFLITVLFLFSYVSFAKEPDIELHIGVTELQSRISVAKVKKLGKLPVDDAYSAQSCGGKYFYDGNNKSGYIKKSYLKFDQNFNKFIREYFNVNDPTFTDIFSRESYSCRVTTIGGEDVLYLRNLDANYPHAIFIFSGEVHVLWGYLVSAKDGGLINICYSDVCVKNSGKLPKFIADHIKSKIMPIGTAFIMENFGDVIVYKMGEGAVFDTKTIFCSYIESIPQKFSLHENINLCSIIFQNFTEGVQSYNVNNNEYLFPNNTNGEKIYYFKCNKLNDCEKIVDESGSVMLSYLYDFPEGVVAVYGGRTTLVSDGFGPDYVFCIKYFKDFANNKCISRENWKDSAVSGDDVMSTSIIYIDKKFYFLYDQSLDGKLELHIDEILEDR